MNQCNMVHIGMLEFASGMYIGHVHFMLFVSI